MESLTPLIDTPINYAFRSAIEKFGDYIQQINEQQVDILELSAANEHIESQINLQRTDSNQKLLEANIQNLMQSRQIRKKNSIIKKKDKINAELR